MSTKTSPQSSHQNYEKAFIAYFMGFLGIFCFTAYLFIFLFNSSTFSLPIAHIQIPVMLPSCISAALVLPMLRVRHTFFEGHQRILLLKLCGVLFTCAAPIGFLFEYLWLPCSILTGLGIASLSFLWSLYMCRFNHSSLATLLSFSTILAALFTAFLLLRNEAPPPPRNCWDDEHSGHRILDFCHKH